jgi:type I restriction enzyme R subunit
MNLTESMLEEAAMAWFNELGYAVAYGPQTAPGEPAAERDAFSDVVLERRLRAAVARLNPQVPEEALDDAVRKVLRMHTPSLIQSNRAFHRMLRDGVEVEYPRKDGSIAGDRVRLADFDVHANNDWLAVNQFAVIEGQSHRRPDIVLFLNGLPLGLIELKNAADETATVWSAYEQVQTYKAELPALLSYNAALVASDGVNARIGSLSASQEWFKVWRTIDGETDAPKTALELEVLVRGVFEQKRFLDLIQHFTAFEEDKDTGTLCKLMAGYHQFHAVNAAVEETLRASGMCPASQISDTSGSDGLYWSGRMQEGEIGDRRAGVVWHTQGSGKSLSMLFYAGQIVRHPSMQNPTLVMLTDRNDLDEQLYGQFQRCHEILGQTPVQAEGREHLRELLSVASGGVVFTTIQKFLPEQKGDRMPCLSDRRNIIVIADEAHRSQYDLIDGLARHMRDALPGATFIGFTGTPIEKTDANTRAVFGDYISIYDIQRAVADKATVPIYYESRIAKLSLNASEMPKLDEEFEELTEGEEQTRKEKLKTKWAALEALVGDPKRIKILAQDIVTHFELKREALSGKAMIVCMSRRICVELYDALLKLRPEWEGAKDDDKEAEQSKDCVVKIVMTGSADDGPSWQRHIRSKEKRRTLAVRFKDSNDPFRIVIVRDMWLTGFDAPSLNTMYLDKPMQGHGLMQAIARVNRVFRDKPGGLVVDYLGLAEQLRKALAVYTESGGKGDPTYDIQQAISVMREKYEVSCGLLNGFDWSKWVSGTANEKLKLLPAGQEHILSQEDGKRRFAQAVTGLSRAFALCAASDEALEIRDDISFFQNLNAALTKHGIGAGKTPDQLDSAIRQLVSKAIVPDGQVIDIFTAAGIARPDISILSDAFLSEVKGLKYKNVAAELLQKLLQDEIKVRSRRNLVLSQLFSEKLKKSLNAYHNRAISTLEFIDELIRIAKDMDAATKRGQDLGLNDDEVAFYDALSTNGTAVKVMGDDQLKVIAVKLLSTVRKSVTIDWNLRESARAKIRVMVRRILREYGYPPDLQEEAVKTVLAQAELICADWEEEQV